MLERILRYLRNWFVVSVHSGEFTVENGGIALPFLKEGQYYRVLGSDLNDGVYRCGSDNLPGNEMFCGEIWALRIPPDLVALSSEIEAWEETNKAKLTGIYQSESFEGYTYTLKSGGDSVSWQKIFSSRLSQWRKL